jgi:hypothetical protein
LVDTVHSSFKANRILTQKAQNFENLLSGKITEEGSPDLREMITTSIAFKMTTTKIETIITTDFNKAQVYVDENFEKCRKVKEFCRDPKNKLFNHNQGQPRQLEEIRSHI